MPFLKSILSIFTANTIGIVVAILNTAIVANIFGTSRDVEIYFATNVLITTLLKLSQSGVMSEVFLPAYLKFKKESKPNVEYQVLSSIINLYLIILILWCVLLFLVIPYLIDIFLPGFSAEDKIKSIKMFRLLLPIMPIIFINGQIQSILNAEQQYGKPETIALISRIAMIAIIIFGYKTLNIWILPISLGASIFIKFIIQIGLYRKIGGRYFFILKVPGFKIKSILINVWSSIPYIGMTQVYTIIFNAALSLLPQGVLAIFSYARNLNMKLESVFMRPVSIVFFTKYATAVSNGQKSMDALVKKTTDLLQAFLFPALLIIIISGTDGLAFIWKSKNFNYESIQIARTVLIALFIGMYAKALNMIVRKVVISLGYAKLLYVYSAFVQLLSAGMVFYLIERYGMNGAILALLINTILMTMVSYLTLHQKGKNYILFYRWESLFKWIIVSIFTYLLINIPLWYYGFYSTAGDSRIKHLIRFISSGTVSVMTVYLLSIVINIDFFRSTSIKLYALIDSRRRQKRDLETKENS